MFKFFQKKENENLLEKNFKIEKKLDEDLKLFEKNYTKH